MSIRLRVALVFTLALAVAFALGSWLFVAQLSAQLLSSTDKQLAAELNAAGQYFQQSGSCRVRSGDYLIQLIDPAGHVRVCSPEAGRVPLVTSGQIRKARQHQIRLTRTLEDEQARIHAGPLRSHPDWVQVAGISLENESATVGSSTTALLVGGSVLVVLGGLGAYWLAAVALSPVERMRREVAALSEQDVQPGVQVPRTRDELAALAGTMIGLLARLHEALARQRGFVADASHELRTPLAVLGAELELAGRPGRSRGDLVLAVANAEDEVARLTRLTNDLLMLARSDEGRLPVRPAPTDVRALLDRSAERAATRAAEGGVRCVVEAPDGLVALVDEDKVGQAVDNLIDNALRFAPAGTQITLSARAAGATRAPGVAGPAGPAGRPDRPDRPDRLDRSVLPARLVWSSRLAWSSR